MTDIRRSGGLLAAALAWAPTAALADDACGALAEPGRFPQTTVASAAAMEPDPQRGLPAYCEVTGTIRPVPGSEIGVVYRLAAAWNGKLLGIGGGGMAGNVKLETAAPHPPRRHPPPPTHTGHAHPDAPPPQLAAA